MAININNLNNNTPITQKSNDAQVKQQSAQQSAQTNQNAQVRQDSVSITPQAKQLAELQKKASDSPQVNQKKVEQLKKVIANGEYKINAEKLAENIAKFEFDLL